MTILSELAYIKLVLLRSVTLCMGTAFNVFLFLRNKIYVVKG
jgi:hypothetical protein